MLKAENAALRRDCQSLCDKVQALEEKAAKDSHNSSKPPSSDGLLQTQAQESAPAKVIGPPAANPDIRARRCAWRRSRIAQCVTRSSAALCCGRSLAKQAPDRVLRRQVFDLPEPKLLVTEHQAEVKTCACACLNRAAFPPEAAAPVQYGPRVKSAAVYLRDYPLLPSDRQDRDHA